VGDESLLGRSVPTRHGMPHSLSMPAKGAHPSLSSSMPTALLFSTMVPRPKAAKHGQPGPPALPDPPCPPMGLPPKPPPGGVRGAAPEARGRGVAIDARAWGDGEAGAAAAPGAVGEGEAGSQRDGGIEERSLLLPQGGASSSGRYGPAAAAWAPKPGKQSKDQGRADGSGRGDRSGKGEGGSRKDCSGKGEGSSRGKDRSGKGEGSSRGKAKGGGSARSTREPSARAGIEQAGGPHSGAHDHDHVPEIIPQLAAEGQAIGIITIEVRRRVPPCPTPSNN
jgi:hypothetical protein